MRNTDSEVEIWSDNERSIARSGHGELTKRSTDEGEDIPLQPRHRRVLRMGIANVRFVLAIEEHIYEARPILVAKQVSPGRRVELPLIRPILSSVCRRHSS